MPEPDLITLWSADARTRHIDPKTIYAYGRSLKQLENFFRGRKVSLSSAKEEDIVAYIEECRQRGLTTRTIRGRMAALSSLYEYMIYWKMKKGNPIQDIRKRYLKPYKTDSEEHTHKLISIDDMARLIGAAVDIRDKAMLIVLAKTGVRRGELLSMEVQDINWQNQSITLKPKKKRSNRTVFFDDEAAYILRRWLEIREQRKPTDPSLWISTWGKRIDKGSIVHVIEKAALQCDLHDPASPKMEDHFSAHCGRHWFTTHLLRAGMRREYVAWLRGDTIKEAVDIYFHIDPADVRQSYLAHVPQLGI